jgi:molybdopterin-guanine dinucleotide biosynthesis protein A
MTASLRRRDVTAIVLAGGASSRFGSDKLAATIAGEAMLDRAITAVSVVVEQVIVAGPLRPAKGGTDGSKVRSLPDRRGSAGPLMALDGALAAVTTEVAVVVAGDMPSLVPSVLALLVDALWLAPAIDAVVLGDPAEPTRRQPLPVALRVARARDAAAETIEAGDQSLVRALGRMTTVELPPKRWLSLDPEARTLVDIDVPEDLERVRDGARDQRMR